MEGNTLFLLGSKNGIGETDDTKDKFGLMPYLSEDGSQNVYILNVTRYHGLSKKLEEDPQKLEDALKVMEILSSVEGTTAVYDESKLKSLFLNVIGLSGQSKSHGKAPIISVTIGALHT